MKVRLAEDDISDPLNSLTEQYHSTPETQTDESYNHPEDIEHFAHHEAIEREEARSEAKYQGITVEEALAQHDPDAQPKGQKVTRVPPPEKQEPEVRYGGAKEESKNKAEWGSGDEGFKTPKTPAERLRKNVPYKVSCPLSTFQPPICPMPIADKQNSRMQYKFKRTWGDF